MAPATFESLSNELLFEIIDWVEVIVKHSQYDHQVEMEKCFRGELPEKEAQFWLQQRRTLVSFAMTNQHLYHIVAPRLCRKLRVDSDTKFIEADMEDWLVAIEGSQLLQNTVEELNFSPSRWLTASRRGRRFKRKEGSLGNPAPFSSYDRLLDTFRLFRCLRNVTILIPSGSQGEFRDMVEGTASVLFPEVKRLATWCNGAYLLRQCPKVETFAIQDQNVPSSNTDDALKIASVAGRSALYTTRLRRDANGSASQAYGIKTLELHVPSPRTQEIMLSYATKLLPKLTHIRLSNDSMSFDKKWIGVFTGFSTLCKLDVPHPATEYEFRYYRDHLFLPFMKQENSPPIKGDPPVVTTIELRHGVNTKSEEVTRSLYRACPRLEKVIFTPNTHYVFLVKCFMERPLLKTRALAKKIEEENGARTQAIGKRDEGGRLTNLEWSDIY